VTIQHEGSGKLTRVPGQTRAFGTGPLIRYRVEIEEGLPFDPAEVAKVVDETLSDPRSWAAAGRARFMRTDDDDVDLRIIVASPATTDELCEPLGTGGELSCRIDDRVALNAKRWAFGAEAFGDDVENYRHYLVNHEVGHALGEGHRDCGGEGELAPVMMQQTKGVGACLPNPWPLSWELSASD
jgi:hypothetical protein